MSDRTAPFCTALIPPDKDGLVTGYERSLPELYPLHHMCRRPPVLLTQCFRFQHFFSSPRLAWAVQYASGQKFMIFGGEGVEENTVIMCVALHWMGVLMGLPDALVRPCSFVAEQWLGKRQYLWELVPSFWVESTETECSHCTQGQVGARFQGLTVHCKGGPCSYYNRRSTGRLRLLGTRIRSPLVPKRLEKMGKMGKWGNGGEWGGMGGNEGNCGGKWGFIIRSL